MEYRRANLVYDDVLHGNVDIGLIVPVTQKDLEVILRKRRTNRCHEPSIPCAKRMVAMKDLQGLNLLPWKKIFLLAKQLMKLANLNRVAIKMEFMLLKPSKGQSKSTPA